jgi:hypothetical protein
VRWSVGTYSLSLNGPVPTAWSLVFAVLSQPFGMMPELRRTAKEPSKPGNGALRLIRTVYLSSTSILLIGERRERQGEPVFSSIARSML